MKPARTFLLLTTLLLVAVLTMALAVYGGDADNPEVGDASGDSTTNRDSHDIIGAWVEDEDNETVTFRIRMTALDVISPRDDWVNLPETIYEYYFTIGDDDYAMRATVPVHGPFAALASFSLYTVEYGESGNMSYEMADQSLAGTYLVNEGDLELSVDKATVGSPTQGELIEHMWAAIYFLPRGGTREVVDEALSYEFPGRTYTIRGQYTQLYDVRLSARNATIESPNNAVATFNITVRSDSTIDVEVNLTNRSLPEGYFVNWSRTMPIAVPEGDSVGVLLMVTIPENATNGTDVMVTVWGKYETEEGTDLVTDNLNLLVQVRYIPAKPPKVDKSIPDQIFDWIKENTLVFSLIIAAGVIGIVGYIIWLRKKKADDDLIHQYQMYADAQSQQREMGGNY
ncbi:MAG: hypothetical protein JSW25_06725 [Thermoplasmata archaeon]|nr:MAG: hypothetical protein JSW25_06725 [Thermoplasmata archaeon]